MLNREDLIKLITKMRKDEYSSEAEERRDRKFLMEKTIDPSASRYVYRELEFPTAEQAADKILSYKSIQLGYKKYD
jgi:hypothetical protein